MIEWLGRFPPHWAVFLAGAMPISEVRGAIPLGLALHLSLLDSFLWAVAGNLFPILPTLIFLKPVSLHLRRFPLWKRFFDWLVERTARKAASIQKYEALGLAIFVAIPLPLTGAWTGCVAASLFRLPVAISFMAITAGVIGAALIVASSLAAGLHLFHAFTS